jgi:hypothetical protein
MSLDDIVRVTITPQTTAPSRVGFGIPCVMAYHTVFPERAREYDASTAVAQMIADGFTATDAAVRAVTALISQNPKITTVIVGREENTQKQKINIAPVATNLIANYDYIVNVNGLEAKYTTDATPTVAEITAGLKAAIDALAQPVTTTDNTTDLDIESNAIADQFRFTVAERQILIQTNETPDGTPNGIAADIAAVQAVNDDWYSIHLTTLSKAVIKAAAAYIETQIKLMVTSSADDAIYDSGSSTDVAAELQTAGYARTALLYHPKALEQFPGAGWAGVGLPKDPGSITWKFKTIAGVDYTVLTADEESAIKNKDCNSYVRISGISMTQEGVTSSGEFIDIVRGLDFMRARLQEYIFARLANLDKVPYTDKGVSVIEAEVRAVLDLCVGQEILAESPEYTVTVPLVADVSFTDKANRLLPDVKFSATLAGAIHATEVDGTVSV